ncbi:MAG: restriction endonuclease subunit S [Flavobacteriaceae bacterium]|nr:restriction endonuclease subunit S [Flavobacteriaceae bacterium]
MKKNKENIQLVPKFRFKEFVGEWSSTTIGDNCTLKGRIGYRGYTKQDLVEEGQGALVLGGKHIQNQYLDISDPTFLKWDKYYESPEIMVEINHIIFSQRGSLGDCALIHQDIGKATINPSMVLIKDITCNIYFLYYILIGNSIQKEVKRISTSAAIPMLSQKQIKEFPFYIPNPKEQQKIANTLSSLDDYIKAETEKLSLLKEHKKGLLQQLFPAKGERVPKKRFPEFVQYGEWVEKALENCLDYLQPTPYLVSNTDYKDEYETPVLTAGKTFILGYTDEKNGIFSDNLPVIIFDDFTTATKFVDFPFKGKSSAMKILIAKNKSNVKFMYEAMQNIKFEVSTHKRHWISIFSKLKILIPTNPQEQQKIADTLTAVDDLITAQTEKIETLKAHKKGLMQGLFPKIEN